MAKKKSTRKAAKRATRASTRKAAKRAAKKSTRKVAKKPARKAAAKGATALKTQPHAGSVNAFLDAIEDDRRRADCKALVKLMRRATSAAPKLWGPTIVGFGSYHYRYASGREGDWFLAGFSPRKRDLTVYVMAGFSGYAPLMKRLGPHKTGKACLYLKGLDEVDVGVLEELVTRSVAHVRSLHAGD